MTETTRHSSGDFGDSTMNSVVLARSYFNLTLLFLLFLLLTVPPGASSQSSIFRVQPSPSPNVQGNTLIAGAAVAADDAWAVGYRNDNNLNDSRTLTEHWDGSAWKVVPSPNPGSIPSCKNSNTGNVLTSIATVASNDVWAVGFSFTCSTDLVPMALHWDGTAWSAMATPALLTNDNSAFNSVVALASNNVYAVGYQPAANGAVRTLIEHWDGVTWQVVSSPNGNSTGSSLFGVSATSPNDIWAVGDNVAPDVPITTLVEHFDGTTWSIIPSPNPVKSGFLAANQLLSVRAESPTDVTAVGAVRDGLLRTLTLIEHWDGAKWRVVASPNQGEAQGDFNTLQSVVAVSPTDLYAIGFFADAATAGQQRTMVQHFDGHAWAIVSSPTKGLAQQLNGGFVLPGAQNVWAVGASAQNGTDPETGFLIIPRTLILFSPIG